MRATTWILVATLTACTDPGDGGDAPDGGDGGDGAIDLPETPSGFPASTDWHCTDAQPTLTAAGGGFRVQTAHFDLEAAVDEAEARELGRMLEAALPAWEEVFGPIPDTISGEVVLAASEADFRAATTADGVSPPAGVGGYFSPVSGRSYLYQQPSVFYTRVLMLHEVTHMVHAAVRTTTEDVPFWVVEGVAEHLGRHDWDGTCLRLGVRPLASLEDPWSEALDDAASADLETWVRDDAFPGRPSVMAWWRYLMWTGDVPDFATWWAEADAGTASYADAVARLAPADHTTAYRAWLEGAQLPFEIVFVDWHHGAPTVIEGSSDVLSLLRRKDAAGTLSATHPWPAGEGSAGMLVGWDDADAYTAILLEADGALTAFEARPEGNLFEPTGVVVPEAAEVTWVLDLDAGTLRVGETDVPLSLEVAPAAGLALYDADVRFTGIQLD